MLNKSVGMRFIIADTALLHMERGDFVRFPLPAKSRACGSNIYVNRLMSSSEAKRPEDITEHTSAVPAD